MDKQMIEEMARHLCLSWKNMYDSCEQCTEKLCCTYLEVAEELTKAGYRKIPEGLVVLTREELDKKYVSISMYELAKAFHNEKCAEFEKLCYDYNKLKTEQEQARKETAENFAERLKARYMPPIKKWDEISIGCLFYDIDEICKEISGGSDEL